MDMAPNFVHAYDMVQLNAMELNELRDISEVGYKSFLELEAQQKREEELQRLTSLIERIRF